MLLTWFLMQPKRRRYCRTRGRSKPARWGKFSTLSLIAWLGRDSFIQDVFCANSNLLVMTSSQINLNSLFFLISLTVFVWLSRLATTTRLHRTTKNLRTRSMGHCSVMIKMIFLALPSTQKKPWKRKAPKTCSWKLKKNLRPSWLPSLSWSPSATSFFTRRWLGLRRRARQLALVPSRPKNLRRHTSSFRKR